MLFGKETSGNAEGDSLQITVYYFNWKLKVLNPNAEVNRPGSHSKLGTPKDGLSEIIIRSVFGLMSIPKFICYI